MEQAADFQDESAALFALLDPLPNSDFARATQFKGWTISDVLQHLHFWNRAACLQLSDEVELGRVIAGATTHADGMRAFEASELNGLSGRALLEAWRKGVEETTRLFASTNPKLRLKWAGPEMSARSSITARLMETWAHGQEIYDTLGVERMNGDRIRNIAHLGVNTFAWTYLVRGLTPPARPPRVRLVAPSGALWEWDEEAAEGFIEGDAAEFCQVVTQVRNIADTSLRCEGLIAADWMAMAQCFAGRPQNPPPPGTRHRSPAA